MVSAPYHLVRGVVWLNPDLEIRQRDGHIYGTFSGRAQLLRLHATGVGHRHGRDIHGDVLLLWFLWEEQVIQGKQVSIGEFDKLQQILGCGS